MVSAPQITVLLPVRNGAAHLQAALDSVLAQTYVDYELLVIDDGSTDETPRIIGALRDPRLRIVTHAQSRGLVPTLNEGLALARGEFVARQDHDDISHPSRLQELIGHLRANAECALVGSQAVQIGEDDRPALPLFRPLDAASIRWYSCFDNPFIHSTVMFRRAVVFEEFGGYPASLHSEDYALWSQLCRRHVAANLAANLLQYREHTGSVTGSLADEKAAAFDSATAAIRGANLRALFGDMEGVDEIANLLSTYRRPLTPDSAAAFLRVFEQLRARFAATFPARTEFRHVCAIQLAELAYRVLPLDRPQAANLYRRAFTLQPSLAAELPWARLLALFLFGENARTLYQRFLLRR